MRTRYANRQAGALRLKGAFALLARVRRVGAVIAPPGYPNSARHTSNRFHAARRQPDITHTDRPLRSRIIPERSLYTRRGIIVILDHGVYLTERTEPGEGPATSPKTPNRTSPVLACPTALLPPSPPPARSVTPMRWL